MRTFGRALKLKKVGGAKTALKMARGLFLVVILLPIVASLESLRGREEGGRDLTCRSNYKSTKYKTSWPTWHRDLTGPSENCNF